MRFSRHCTALSHEAQAVLVASGSLRCVEPTCSSLRPPRGIRLESLEAREADLHLVLLRRRWRSIGIAAPRLLDRPPVL